jgi:hypothetical protein
MHLGKSLSRCALCAVVWVSVAASSVASWGAAFSYRSFGAGPDGDGIGILNGFAASADPANSFFRWQQATITYSFTASFTAAYGAAGQQAVNQAFVTWDSSLLTDLPGGNNFAAPMQAGDPSVLGFQATYDLQSVALHEIGHVLGADHPDVASLINNNTTGDNGGVWPNPPAVKNYNVQNGVWVRGALPAGSHPVMWSTLEANTRRRVLTDDDDYFAQYLYANPPGGGNVGPLGGPVFGGGVPFTFSQVATGGNVIINGGILPAGTLASTGVTTADISQSWWQANAANITFNVPEPSTGMILVVFVVVVLMVRKRAAA